MYRTGPGVCSGTNPPRYLDFHHEPTDDNTNLLPGRTMPHPTKSEQFNRALDKIIEGTKILNNEFSFPTNVTVKTDSGT